MKNSVPVLLIVLFAVCALAQTGAPAKAAPAAPPDVSGMYTFLRDGEFVQIDVEGSKVSGFISRYGDAESDRGAFLDQLISKGSLEGNKLTFTTRAVHGITYEFKGTVERGEGKTPGAEAYYVLKGTLTMTTIDANKNPIAKSREVVFKAFPSDAMAEPSRKKD
jgi:hypothetical protein